MENTNKQLNTDENSNSPLSDVAANAISVETSVANAPVDGQTPTADSIDEQVEGANCEQSTDVAVDTDVSIDETAISQSSPLTDPVTNADVAAQTVGGATSTRAKSKISKTIDILLWILVVVLATLVVVRAFVYTDVTVWGESMVPTYQHEEVVHVSKVKSPQRGDVVVFYKNDVQSKFLALFAIRKDSESGGKYEKLIKRVVALSGDKLWVEQVEQGLFQVIVETPDGTIYHEDYYVKGNDNLPADRYLITSDPVYGLGRLKGYTQDNPFTVSEGCFFAMGDNRGDSYDSRSFGEVPLDRLFGVVL